jgi:6-phosphogluconolactonase
MAQHTIYLGTYTGPLSKGIYRCTLDGDTGQLSEPVCIAEVKNPSFLALSPDGRFLYAALDAAVAAYSIGTNGTVTALNQQPSGGQGCCHVWVDASGKNVLVANYGSGTLAAFPVLAGGSLAPCSALIQHTGTGPNPRRQEKAHAHSIYTDPSNRFVYSCDLGIDEVKIYRFDATSGTFLPADPSSGQVPPGGGPRHLAFYRDNFAYVCNEMGLSVTAFQRDTLTGALSAIETVPTLPPETPTAGASTAEIFAHPTGPWLYVSNRGPNTITSYTIGADGKLTWLEQTPTPNEPRGFGLSPDGQWLVVGGQKDNMVQAFRVDVTTGKLTPIEQRVQVGAPVSVLFAS